MWALFVVYGVFYGLTEPVEKALVSDLVRRSARGRAYGAYNFVVGITALPAGLLTGALWRVWGPARRARGGRRARRRGVAGAAGLERLADAALRDSAQAEANANASSRDPAVVSRAAGC